jgi:hypothetical protein
MVFVGFVWNPLYLPQGDFNLIFKYGVGEKNELNTFRGTFTKDMVIDPSIKIRLTLSKQELAEIYQKMIEIDFFNLPESFPDRPDYFVTPRTDYYLKVQNGSLTKEVSWNTNSQLDADIDKNLHELVDLIGSIIEQKLEYKILPRPRGAYL